MRETICNERGNLSFRGWTIIVIIFLITIFVLQNTEMVEITFLLWHMNISRVLLLLGAICLGVVLGLLLGWDIFRKKKGKEISGNSSDNTTVPPKPSVD